MKRLTEKEEAILAAVWKLEGAFVKEVRHELSKPRPHVNTVATTMRRLADKGFLRVESFGSNHRYHAAITQEGYAKKFVRPMLHGVFGGSVKRMLSFFAEEEELSEKELREIVNLIEKRKS